MSACYNLLKMKTLPGPVLAIGAIFVVTVFGDNIRALFGSSANALQGTSTSSSDLGGQVVDDSATKKTLKNFQEGAEGP